MTTPMEFDAIFSLGHNCQVAAQLRRNKLRQAAGPLDWFNFASTHEFCKVIKHQFSDFMLRDNLVIYGKSVNCYYVRDKRSSCLSFHDFKNNPEEQPLYDYPVFRERLDRRIERFNRNLNSEQKTLLVRIIPHKKDAETIDQVIRETYSNPNVTLFFLMLSSSPSIVTLPSFSDRVLIKQIPKGPTWEGDLEAWKTILGEFLLISGE
ncbi:DUF1796 family putative cysteine peptidase [Paenibacillus lautus]|uniref:DUF1796 family putative cysteine peptidase n=1 Tax=Paenibacillus lautus TaxID=1401 RepID=UPI002DB7D7C1|nr:DUF1796 family putative cysteine peptidase [Paenibacillus lautus]MEC0306878.1 DUF1796 family putative cysteine peptidase [Paenibacillus lautus]